MKVYKMNDRNVLYGFADHEGAAERRKHKSAVMKDRKKDRQKNQCRNTKSRRGMYE